MGFPAESSRNPKGKSLMKMIMEAKERRLKDDQEEGRAIDLPVEVLAEILWKLPLKSAYQLKLVCKTWNSFISSPDFFGLRVKSNNDIDPILIPGHQSFALLLHRTEKRRSRETSISPLQKQDMTNPVMPGNTLQLEFGVDCKHTALTRYLIEPLRRSIAESLS